ncbi:MAG TPA: ABC transporter permease [Chloroflexia bacterium]|nr:ABC transporter permease [Chloroflexia bacterium]
MTRYVLRRLLILPFTLAGISLLVFLLLSLLDPAERALMYTVSQPQTPRALDDLIAKYGLDRPWPVQYLDWLGRVLRGDLGWSTSTQQPVMDAIRDHFPATLELTLCSFVPILAGGIWLGIMAAANYGRWLDRLARVGSILALSTPTFVSALVLIMVFYAGTGWFPPGRLSDWARLAVHAAGFQAYTGLNTVDGLLNGRPDIALDAVRHLVLPVATLLYVNTAFLLRITRSSMLEALRQDYTTVARAKGLSRGRVLHGHARPNALIPVATVGGLLLAGLLNGAGLAELVFDYHGLGWWAVRAATTFDLISVLGFALLSATLLLLANLVVDILYGVLDPRIRLR